QLARLAVFTVAPAQVGYSTVPTSEWEVRHSCLSAYFVAGQPAKSVPNIYDDALYSLPDDDPTATRKPRMPGPFRTDYYDRLPPPRSGSVCSLPRPPPRTAGGRGLPGVSKPCRAGDQLLGAGNHLQARAVRRSGDDLRRREDGRVVVHADRGRGNGPDRAPRA